MYNSYTSRASLEGKVAVDRGRKKMWLDTQPACRAVQTDEGEGADSVTRAPPGAVSSAARIADRGLMIGRDPPADGEDVEAARNRRKMTSWDSIRQQLYRMDDGFREPVHIDDGRQILGVQVEVEQHFGRTTILDVYHIDHG